MKKKQESVPGKGGGDGGGKYHIKVGRSNNTVGGETVDQEHGDHTACQMSKESPEPLLDVESNWLARLFQNQTMYVGRRRKPEKKKRTGLRGRAPELQRTA